ncbi:MAG: BMP family ABC transporter substrate-binding protein [Deltaproteobacteria bacterium]|nr:BMP family ABC transporter substrate-binding protein [Deltaproteobacteria bacterium]
MLRRAGFAWVAVSALLLLAGPGARGAETPPKAAKVGFLYVGPVSDVGWTWAHDQGRLKASKAAGVESIYLEKVAEGPDAERALRALAAKGCGLIFATSFGYMDSVLKVAAELPKVKFEHATGYKRGPNVGTYDGRGYEPWYLAGVVAGKMTKKNVVGFLMAYPIPECVRNCNAFTLGARSVNPKVECRIVTINTWFDPVKEREGAQALVDAGVDVLARESDSNAADKLAEQRGVYSIAYNSVVGAGPNVLTAPVWDWSVRYRQVIGAWKKGSWKSEDYWGGIKQGVIDLAPLSAAVPADVKALVAKEREAIKAGKLFPFAGEIVDRDGKVHGKKGKVFTDEELRSMDWLVAGVVGTLR